MASLYNVYIDKTGSTYTPTVRYQATAPSDGTNLAGVRNNANDLTATLDWNKMWAGVDAVLRNDRTVRGV